jgi:adenosylcobyric acid synthase
MGKTFPAEPFECAHDFHSAFEHEGAISDSGLVIGTYLHGFFTNQNAVNALVSYLCEKKGYSYTEPEQTLVDPFDHLADHLERYLDVKEILRHFEY